MSRKAKEILISRTLPANSANTDFLYNETENKLYFRNRKENRWDPLEADTEDSSIDPNFIFSASANSARVALGYANSASSHVNILAQNYANSAQSNSQNFALEYANSASTHVNELALNYANEAQNNSEATAFNYANSASTDATLLALEYANSASTNAVSVSLEYTNSASTNIISSLDSGLLKKIDYEIPVNAQSGTSYNFTLDDARRITTATSASAKTFTILPSSSVSWLSNTVLRVVNFGAGSLAIAGASGVTVANSSTTFGPNEGGNIMRTASNSWTVVIGGGGGFANFSNSPTGTYVENDITYKYVTYTGNSSLTITKAGFLDVLLVGGGGGSSADGNNRIGGGGAGGVRYGAFIVPIGTYTITIGAGGGGAANFAGTGGATSISSVLSVGGGSGGNSGFVSQISSAGGGGSGGGFFFDANFSGGGTSFGGGAGAAGGTAGISLSYTGSAVTYGVGGTTGAGTANRGNGGSAGASGGSGIVIVRTRA